jgi:L-ascorbate metabolism protein UlaG (beta-lactamase superfamily)
MPRVFALALVVVIALACRAFAASGTRAFDTRPLRSAMAASGWAPRTWLEPRFNIVRRMTMPRGWHFAAFEQPHLLADDVGAVFRDLRAPVAPLPIAPSPVIITPLVHSSVQIEHGQTVIQVDPWSLGDLTRAKPADLILVTDDPVHHLDPNAIARLRKPGAPVLVPTASHAKLPGGTAIANGESKTMAGVTVEAIPAYDIKPGEPSHPKGKANGYLVTVGGQRLYFAGVTECVPEMRAMKNIDVAFVPMNLPLDRMTPAAAAECVNAFRPKAVYLYHYDQSYASSNGRNRTANLAATVQAFRAALDPSIAFKDGEWYP